MPLIVVFEDDAMRPSESFLANRCTALIESDRCKRTTFNIRQSSGRMSYDCCHLRHEHTLFNGRYLMSSEFTIRLDVHIGLSTLGFNVECTGTSTRLFSEIDRYSFEFHSDAGRFYPCIGAASPFWTCSSRVNGHTRRFGLCRLRHSLSCIIYFLAPKCHRRVVDSGAASF